MSRSSGKLSRYSWFNVVSSKCMTDQSRRDFSTIILTYYTLESQISFEPITLQRIDEGVRLLCHPTLTCGMMCQEPYRAYGLSHQNLYNHTSVHKDEHEVKIVLVA